MRLQELQLLLLLTVALGAATSAEMSTDLLGKESDEAKFQPVLLTLAEFQNSFAFPCDLFLIGNGCWN